MEKDPKIFWQEIHKLLGHKKSKTPTSFRDEHNRKLTTEVEIAEAFRHRLFNTFRITEEEIVDRWHRENAFGLGFATSPITTFVLPKITETEVTSILKSFKEKPPGPSGITRNLLLN